MRKVWAHWGKSRKRSGVWVSGFFSFVVQRANFVHSIAVRPLMLTSNHGPCLAHTLPEGQGPWTCSEVLRQTIRSQPAFFHLDEPAELGPLLLADLLAVHPP